MEQPVQLSWRRLETWSGCCYDHLDQHSNNRDSTSGEEHPQLMQSHSLDKCLRTEYDSICFDALGSETGNTRHHIIPRYVNCLATLAISDACQQQQQEVEASRFMCHEPIRLEWADELAYWSVHESLDDKVKQYGPKSKRSYLKMVHAILLQWTGAKFEAVDSCVVEQRKDWFRHVPYMIAKYCVHTKRSLFPFYLEFHSHFEYFELDSYHTHDIRELLRKTILENFQEEFFWSKKFLRQLFDRFTISQVVKSFIESSTLQDPILTLVDQGQFVDWIYPNRIRLFATAIRGNINISHLYKLKQLREGTAKNVGDDQIPLSNSFLRQFLDKMDASDFVSAQRGFRPYHFRNPNPQPGDEDVEDDCPQIEQLVPVCFNPEVDRIGHGGFGEVYKATIHPDFHAFSSDRNEKFALKVSNDTIYHPAINEVKAWHVAAKYPHSNITPLYTSWLQTATPPLQGDRCYMLCPLADGSLEDLITGETTFDIVTDTRWLLDQLEGLAAGIYHIHNIGLVTLRQPERVKEQRFYCAYHHDLKPANILCFGPTKESTWKIADFGTSRIYELFSSQQRDPTAYAARSEYPGGDLEYGGPDRRFDPDHVGRKYDIWSYGCILLEVLVWIFGRGDCLKRFRKERFEDLCQGCTCPPRYQTDKEITPVARTDSDDGPADRHGGGRFWYECGKVEKRFHLKPSVEDHLKWVKDQAGDEGNGHPLLKRLCEDVEQMLKPIPSDRPPASTVKDRLGDLRYRAGFNFRPKISTPTEEIGDVMRSEAPRTSNLQPSRSPVEEDTGDGRSWPVSHPSKRKADDLVKLSTARLLPTSTSILGTGSRFDDSTTDYASASTTFAVSSSDESTSKRRRLRQAESRSRDQHGNSDSSFSSAAPTLLPSQLSAKDEKEYEPDGSLSRSPSPLPGPAIAPSASHENGLKTVRSLAKKSDDPSVVVKIASDGSPTNPATHHLTVSYPSPTLSSQS